MALIAAPKIVGLALSCDGLRLVATVEVLNAARSRSVRQRREVRGGQLFSPVWT